ncbi:hypothetical protein ACFORL_06180 [Legionella dresdenensis]|uniref:Dot/Icm T4SS effector n=1 Tax=Legionella dresdenensis TaxID=450200 RepID=A0ABV8CEA2_9GAMM
MMKRSSILQGYINKLSLINDSNQETAAQLAQELSQVSTTEEIEKVLADYQWRGLTQLFAFFCCGRDSLACLKSWYSDMQQLNALKQSNDLQEIIRHAGEIPHQVKPLINLLLSIGGEKSKSSLHPAYYSLLKKLTNKSVPINAVFQFLSQLTLKDIPNPAPRGSFADVTFKEANYELVAQMLFSLPPPERLGLTGEAANGILQDVLEISIYLHSPDKLYLPVPTPPAIENGLR